MGERRTAGPDGRRATLAGLAVLALVSSGAAKNGTPVELPFRVIVNAHNPTTAADRALLADLFLKRTTRWPDGTLVRPVDLVPRSPVRRVFDERILGRSVSAVRNAWQEAIFSGRDVPPPELADDAEVIAYVAAHEGAIGYVAPGAPLGSGVRALAVR